MAEAAETPTAPPRRRSTVRGPVSVLGLAFLLAFVWGPLLGLPSPADLAQSIPPCAYEDGPPPCYWDANERGNRRGRSYVIREDGSTYGDP